MVRSFATVHTRELLAEDGGFLYDSDANNDELPYFVTTLGRPFLVVPYTKVHNDVRYLIPPTYASPRHFSESLQPDPGLPARGGAGRPRRQADVGRRALALERAAGTRLGAARLHRVRAGPATDVAFMRRIDIAEFWAATYPPGWRYGAAAPAAAAPPASRCGPGVASLGTSAISRIVYGSAGCSSICSTGPDSTTAPSRSTTADWAIAPHQGQVVGDEDHGEVTLALEPAQLLHDDRLHGHVERGGHLVADQQVGLHHQGAGDRDPLPFPAGQLVRVAASEVAAQRHVLQHPGGALGPLPVRQPEQLLQRLRDDLADGLAGVERGVRVLEDVLDPAQRSPSAGPAAPRTSRAPSKVISPVQLLCRPTMQRASVVFPEPDSPTTATHHSGGTSRSTPDSTGARP